MRDLAGIEPEPMMPHPAFARMGIAFFSPGQMAIAMSSWDDMGKWYSGLTAGRRDPSPEISETVRQLTAGKTDFDDKVRALASFLQAEVRYVAIEIGIGGYQPHPAADIFRARYGDCKDKATLLSSMLKAVGIDSDYVVINTERGKVDPSLASERSFNHVILAIRLPEGANAPSYHSVVTSRRGKRYLIVDPTDPYTPLGDVRGDLQNNLGLLVTDSEGELIRVPLEDPDTNLLVR